MRIRVLVLSLLWGASLYGQRGHHHFNWQNYCFSNPGSPVCPGHDYAIKRPRASKNGPASGSGVTYSDPSSGDVTGTPILDGGIDWRFADPEADAVARFDFSGLSASPLAHNLIAQLGASQGLTEADMQKVFGRLSGVDRIAISIREGRIVAMVVGRVTDAVILATDGGLKAVPVSANAMLAGHADAVDQAVRRLPANSLAAIPGAEPQDRGEFWAEGDAGLVSSEAVSAGMKQFSMTVSVRGRFASDVAFEFDGPPGANAIQTWQSTLGATTLEGNVLHIKMSMEADEAQQKFGRIVSSPLGQRLAGLVKAAQYLPVRDPNAPKQFRPVINGLK